MQHRLYIVGAGPGDPDLLTVKAHRVLMQADVVLYDALLGKQILEMLPESCKKVYVGKTYKDQQDQIKRMCRINALMKKGVEEGKRVVRLKTGDPLIFGRGIEEVRFLRNEKIDYELVPGITAGIAAANHCQIPITERSINRTLLFCTGTTLDGDMKQFDAVSSMIQLGTPVMIYMGLNNLGSIIDKLIGNGVKADTSICAISKVSYPDEKMLFGNLSNFMSKLEQNPLEMPTIMLIGENIMPMLEEADELLNQCQCNDCK